MADLSNLFGGVPLQPRRAGPFDLAGPKANEFKRKIAIGEAKKFGLSPQSGDEFYRFMGQRLFELGDAEGAQIIEQERAEQMSALAKQQAAAKQQNFENTLSLEGAERERESSLRAGQQLNLNRERVQLERERLEKEAEKPGLNALDRAKAKKAAAEARMIEAEIEFLEANGRLPSTKGGAGGDGDAFSEALGVVGGVYDLLNQGDTFGSIAGVPGAIKSKFGGLLRQFGLNISTNSAALDSFLEVLQAQIGPELLKDSRLSNEERARIKRIVGSLDGITDEKLIVRKMQELEAIVIGSGGSASEAGDFNRNNRSGGAGGGIIDFNELPD